MRVLHIANWYPCKRYPYKALWIKRHIDSLSDHCDSFVYHVEIEKGPFKLDFSSEATSHRKYLISLPFEIWKLNELIYGFLVAYILLFREKEKGWDLLNVHIAYPLLTYFRWIKDRIAMPIVISEHWSAYHYHFNIPGSKKLSGIKQIFHHQLPVITVSNALGQDIKQFAGVEFENWVLPNIIDTQIFRDSRSTPEHADAFFLMVSQWKHPKIPELAIRAFLDYAKFDDHIQLKVVGYGPQLISMKAVADGHDRIHFLGPREPLEIASLMRDAVALVHPSKYETFSVVCAEAIASGCPVIASKVGGIPEFVDDRNGILVQNEKSSFVSAMQGCIESPPKMVRSLDFSSESIGRKYYECLQMAKHKFIKSSSI